MVNNNNVIITLPVHRLEDGHGFVVEHILVPNLNKASKTEFEGEKFRKGKIKRGKLYKKRVKTSENAL